MTVHTFAGTHGKVAVLSAYLRYLNRQLSVQDRVTYVRTPRPENHTIVMTFHGAFTFTHLERLIHGEKLPDFPNLDTYAERENHYVLLRTALTKGDHNV